MKSMWPNNTKRSNAKMPVSIMLFFPDQGLFLLSGKTDVLPPNLAKSRSHEFGYYNDRIVLKFDRHLGCGAAEVPVNFQSGWKSLNPTLAASKLRETLWWDVRPRVSFLSVAEFGPSQCHSGDATCVMSSIIGWDLVQVYHIEAGTKWPPFRRRKMRMHFLTKRFKFR